MVAGEAASELNSLSRTSDLKQSGRAVPSLIHKKGPKEMKANVNLAVLCKERQPLSVL